MFVGWLEGEIWPVGLKKAVSDASFLRNQLSEFDLSALRMKQQETRSSLQATATISSR